MKAHLQPFRAAKHKAPWQPITSPLGSRSQAFRASPLSQAFWAAYHKPPGPAYSTPSRLPIAGLYHSLTLGIYEILYHIEMILEHPPQEALPKPSTSLSQAPLGSLSQPIAAYRSPQAALSQAFGESNASSPGQPITSISHSLTL